MTMARDGKLPTPMARDAKGVTSANRNTPSLPVLVSNPRAFREQNDADKSEFAAKAARSERRLPTPRASDATKSGNSTADRDPNKRTLVEEINYLRERGLLPTPTATDHKASGTAGNWTKESGRNAGATLTDVVVRRLDTPSNASGQSSTPGEPTGIGGTRLSQRFVEWLMNLPRGWVDVPMPTSSTSSEMGLSLRRQRSRTSSSPTDSSNQMEMFQRETSET